MCDLAGLFGGGESDLLKQQLEMQQDAQRKAEKAQKLAEETQRLSADSASEQARLAAEAKMKKTLSAGAFGATLPSTNLGAAPVATRQLYGS